MYIIYTYVHTNMYNIRYNVIHIFILHFKLLIKLYLMPLIILMYFLARIFFNLKIIQDKLSNFPKSLFLQVYTLIPYTFLKQNINYV